MKFDTTIHDTKDIWDYVHLNVWGPFKTPLLEGKQYIVTFVDDFSKRFWMYTMKTRMEGSKFSLNGKI